MKHLEMSVEVIYIYLKTNLELNGGKSKTKLTLKVPVILAERIISISIQN